MIRGPLGPTETIGSYHRLENSTDGRVQLNSIEVFHESNYQSNSVPQNGRTRSAEDREYNDQQVPTKLMTLCNRRLADTFPIAAGPFSGPRPVGCFSVR